MSLEFDFRYQKDDFNLEMASSLSDGVTGVFGASGAGKTTLLHLIAGIQKPSWGSLRWRGVPIVDMERGKWLPPYKRRIAVVFQESRLFPHLNVLQNLTFGEAHIPYDARRFQREEVISLLRLEGLLDKQPNVLSGGEAQRVALGRALMSSPHLLCLDEPFASLDSRMQAEILPFLIKIKQQMGIPMVLVSHDLAFLLQLADQLLLVDGGKCIGHGNFLDLIQDSEIAKVLDHDGLLNVLETSVVSIDTERGLASLQLEIQGKQALGAMNWWGPIWSSEVSRWQVGLRPTDIAIAIDQVPNMTMQNQIPAVVDRVFSSGNQVRCILNVGVPLLAELTLHAANSLRLKPGKPVYAFFKAQALQKLAML